MIRCHIDAIKNGGISCVKVKLVQSNIEES